jgi:hypothetical protein
MSEDFNAYKNDPNIDGEDVIATQGDAGWKVKVTLTRLAAWLTTVIGPLPLCLATYTEVPNRNALQNIHGGLSKIVNDHNFRDSGNLTLTGVTAQGIGKIIIVPIGGDTFVGTFTITGTTVNRDTGAKLTNQTEIINITNNAEDTTADDANGITKHNFTNALITDNWFDGGDADIVISTAGTAITQADIYNCAFEQFDSARVVVIQSLDVNVLCTAASGASLSAYMYKVIVNGNIVNIEPIASIVKNSAIDPFVENRYHRLRIGNIDLELNGANSGIFVEMAFLGTPSKFADASIKVWAKVIL